MNKEYRQTELFPNVSNSIERRYFDGKIELRNEGENGNIDFDFHGLASRTGVEYVMFEDNNEVWTEEISSNAFDGVLSQDIRVLINHDSNLILARTDSGTAKVEKTTDGLRYSWKNDPEISYAKDLARSIERGDITQSSFGFFTEYGNSDFEKIKMADGRMKFKRTINKIDLVYDVSPVTFPASSTTEVSKRSFENALNEYKNALAAEKRAEDKPETPVFNEQEYLELSMRLKGKLIGI